MSTSAAIGRPEAARASVEAARLAALGRLVSGAAHEINNPLFAILGLVEFLLAEAEPGSRAHERLRHVQQSGIEIKQILRAVLDFAREPLDVRGPVALTDVVRATVDLVRRTTAGVGPDLVELYDEADTTVDGSAGQLRLALLDLVLAAQDAAGGGTVRIAVAREAASVTVSVRADSFVHAPEATTVEVVRAHGGELAVSPGAVTLRLPAARAS